MKKSSTFLQAAGCSLFKIIRRSIYAAILIILLTLPKLTLAQQTDIPRGVILFGGTNVDFVQMRDSLGINWVQGYSGVATEHKSIDSNAAGIKVLAQRANIDNASTSQHMHYEAEQGIVYDWSHNYFAVKATGTVDPSAWVCQKGIHSAGYMVQQPTPNNEFHYGHTNYTATFRLKIDDKSNPSASVATLYVIGNDANGNVIFNNPSTLTESSFSSTNNYQSFTIPFTVPQQSGSQRIDIKAARANVMTATSAVDHIDIQVYWYGNVDTWLDYVDVDDDVSLNLFAGQYDQLMHDDINDYLTGYYQVQRLYTRDEPFIPSFLPYKYVDAKLKSWFPTGGLPRGRAITEDYWSGTIQNRFFLDAQPNEYIYETQVFKADIPSPSVEKAYNFGLIPDRTGIAAYTTDADYTNAVQSRFDWLATAFKDVAEVTRNNSVEFWFSAHMDGVFRRSTGLYTKPASEGGGPEWRPPTGNELNAIINCALAYGAKAIIPYPYGTDGGELNLTTDYVYPGLVSKDTSSDGKTRNHSGSTTRINLANGSLKTIFTGYSEKWNVLSRINANLNVIGPTLAAITWQGTKSWSTGLTSGNWTGLVTNVSVSVTYYPLPTGATTMVSSTTISPAAASAPNFVETGHFKNGSTDYLYLVNRRTGVLSQGEAATITVSLNNSTSSEIYNVGTGTILIIPPNGSFTCSFVPGDAALFKISPATWSGTKNIVNSVTIPSGATLTVNAATVLNFATGDSLVATGILNVNGTSSQPVTFTRSGISGNWGCIVFNGSGAAGSTLSYANLQYGAEIDVKSTSNVTIQHCNITNNSGHGIYLYSSSNCLMQNNTIANSNANHGIRIDAGTNDNCYQNVIYKTNHIQNGAGIMYSGSSGYVGQNDIRYYNWGIGAIWGASPASYWPSSQRNNRITNCQRGLKVYHLSYPNFGPIQTSPYSYNSIYSNNYNVDLNTDGYNTSTLQAVGNYWATSNPSSTFLVGSGSSVNWWPTISTNPWNGFPLPSSSQVVAGNTVNTGYSASLANGPGAEVQGPISATSVQDSLQVGIGLRDQSRHNEAKDFFISYLKRHPDNQAGYVYLYSCADNSTISSIIQFFKSLPSQASNAQKLLLSNLYLVKGDIESAKEVNDSIVATNPNTPFAEKAKLNNFYIALYNENDPLTASSILKDVENSASLSSPMDISDAEHALSFYANADSVSSQSSSSAISATTLSKSQTIEQSTTDVEENLPKDCGLSQNYPNPFNPTTMIDFRLPKDSHVTLKVYDVLGRHIMTLVDQYESAGYHSVVFDASRLGSGVYIYKLSAGDFNQIKRMVVIK
jgi:parallel beta-helix repeat protein